jgi:hypothetical protein
MKKGMIILLVSLIAILIVGGIGLSVYLGLIPNVAVGCSGGATLTSADSISIRTSSDLGGKKVIRAVFNTVPTGECLDIQLNPDQIEQQLKDAGINNFDAQKSILADISLIKSQKVYPLNFPSNALTLKKIGSAPIQLGLTEFCTQQTCKNKGYPNTFASIKESVIQGCKCYYDSPVGLVGDFLPSRQIEWQTDIDFGSRGKISLTNQQLSGSLGSFAFAKWAGNLYGNSEVGSINYKPFLPYTTNDVVLVDSDISNLDLTYNSLKNALIDCDKGAFVTSCPNVGGIDARQRASAYNNELSAKLQNRLPALIQADPIIDEGTTINSNELIAVLNSPNVYPQFILDVDASAVGVFQVIGIPSVTCPSNIPTLDSSKTSAVSFNLKNIGDSNGAFTYELSCDKGNQFISPSPPQKVSSGDSLMINSQIGLTVQEGKDISSCTFSAWDINAPSNKKTCSFSYESEHISKCIEGSKTCEAGNAEVWTCKSDGSYVKEQCEFGCEPYKDTARCVAGGNDQVETQPGECAWYDLPCQFKTWAIDFLKPLKIGATIIIGLLAGLLGFAFYRDFEEIAELERKWYVALIFGVIFAGVGAFLAYFYFLFAVLGLFLFFIVKWGIGFLKR